MQMNSATRFHVRPRAHEPAHPMPTTSATRRLRRGEGWPCAPRAGTTPAGGQRGTPHAFGAGGLRLVRVVEAESGAEAKQHGEVDVEVCALEEAEAGEAEADEHCAGRTARP